MSQAEMILGAYCCTTFAKIKASSLINIKKNCINCIADSIKYFCGKGFKFIVLKEENGRYLLLVYNKQKLQEIVNDNSTKMFLEREGYNYSTLDDALKILKKRFTEQEFPHEIGVFLDYPIEDVEGFINSPNNFECVGYWKVYKDKEKKLNTFKRFDMCTKNIMLKMQNGRNLKEIFSY